MSLFRIQRAQHLLIDKGIQALIIDDPIDLFYLTGQELSLGRLYIQRDQVHLFVDGRYFEACQNKAPLSVVLTQGYESDSAFGKFVSTQKVEGGKIGFDAAFTSYRHYEELQERVGKKCHLLPMQHPIKELRQIKEPSELAILREATALGSEGYDYVLSLLKEGITEEQVALELELFWKKKGGKKLAFDSIIAFGAGSSQPHYHSGSRRLKQGDIVLIDIGVVVDHYHSDMTRVAFFGPRDPEMERVYRVVQQAQKAALALCRPGTYVKELDEAARAIITAEGYGERFPHSLGHGVGLEVHELPVIKGSGAAGEVVLEEGMVITIEPGIYLPDLGGVRLEDMVAITKEGHEDLTKRPL